MCAQTIESLIPKPAQEGEPPAVPHYSDAGRKLQYEVGIFLVMMIGFGMAYRTQCFLGRMPTIRRSHDKEACQKNGHKTVHSKIRKERKHRPALRLGGSSRQFVQACTCSSSSETDARANPSQNAVTGSSGSMSCPESCNTTNMFAAVTELVSLLAGIHL